MGSLLPNSLDLSLYLTVHASNDYISLNLSPSFVASDVLTLLNRCVGESPRNMRAFPLS